MRLKSTLKYAVAATALAIGAFQAAPAIAQADSSFFAEGGVYLEADSVTYERENGRYIAEGNVEARYEERVVRAGRVEYLPSTGQVFASGGVTIIEANGTVEYAQDVELTDDLSTGLAESFSIRLPNDGKAMASYASRKGEKNQLTNAVYTACPIPEDISAKPTWRLRARKVVQDNEEEMIYYRDAVFEVKGVPVFYTPFFAHPDPAVERKSGLLMPTFGLSSKTGAWYQQPVYWAVTPSQDLTITPRVMTNVNPLIGFEYTKRFFSGVVELEGSGTYEQLFGSEGDKFGDEKLRGHIFGSGLFSINEDWSWGFGVERVSDDLYLDRYDLNESDTRRGIYAAERKRLISQLFVAGQDENSYNTAAVVDFQGLRANEDDDTLPQVLPIVESRHFFDLDSFGRVETVFDGVALTRSDGVDYRRATGELDWKARWVSSGGFVAEPFAFGRVDFYDISDAIDPITRDETDDDFSRLLGLAGVDLTYPFYRPGESVDWMIEPRVQLIAAAGDNDDFLNLASGITAGTANLVNQDSLTLDLGESNLFQLNKFTGFDRWEEGLRANYDARVSALWGRDAKATLFLGQSLRDNTDFLPEESGLASKRSDYVVEASYEPDRRWKLGTQVRLDEDDFETQRLAVNAQYRGEFIRASAEYINFSNDFSRRGPQEEMDASLEWWVRENWSIGYGAKIDMDEGEFRRQYLSLGYEDCCTAVRLVYQDNNVSDRALGPSESIVLRFSLKSLGAFGTR